MKPIPTIPFLELDSGHSIVMTSEGGTVDVGVDIKGSPRRYTYNEGAWILVDPKGDVVVGPIAIEAAMDLAHAVASCKAEALTRPQAIHILATALIAVMAIFPDVDEDGLEAPAAISPKAQVN